VVVAARTGGLATVPEPVGPLAQPLAYAVSKAALNRLGNAIAPELRDLGIAVVMVDPGFTRTDWWS
jgi:NAD(P)-dependent dehydrogenase (short-subunit alcohol dehydrogenase family)